ncbi:MAG: hypothetical protein ACRC2T_17405 [Thermoguttaceae bacterium]
MTGNARYTNKNWARKAMTILLDEMVMFTTDTRRTGQMPLDEYELGIKFHAKEQGEVTLWPTCESDLSEIRDLAR